VRKAIGVQIQKSGFWIFAGYRVALSASRYIKLRKRVYDLLARDPRTARALFDEPGRRLWFAAGEFWWDSDGHTAEEIELILWDRARRKDAKVERLRKIKARPELADARRRELIPDDVRVHVWERDGGRCARCGADEDLQFDHVIPVAKGGASGAANLQLLCGDCNRQKGDAIA
jgi:hypothetical protein